MNRSLVPVVLLTMTASSVLGNGCVCEVTSVAGKGNIDFDVAWTVNGAQADPTTCEGDQLDVAISVQGGDVTLVSTSDGTTVGCTHRTQVFANFPEGGYDVLAHLVRKDGQTGPLASGRVTLRKGDTAKQTVTLDLKPPPIAAPDSGSTDAPTDATTDAPSLDANAACPTGGITLDFGQPIAPSSPDGTLMCAGTYGQGAITGAKIHDWTHGTAPNVGAQAAHCNVSMAALPAPLHLDLFGGEIEIPLAGVGCKPVKAYVGLDTSYGDGGAPFPLGLDRLAVYTGATFVENTMLYAPIVSVDIPAGADTFVAQRGNSGTQAIARVLWIRFE